MTTKQHGVLAIDQLRDLGVTKSELTANIAAGRWRRLYRSVIWTANGPLCREAALHAGVLCGGAHAVLSHRTAAEEWGMVRIAPGPVHVTVPYGTSAISRDPTLVIHRSRAMRHIRVELAPARTSKADTVLDLAVDEPDAAAAARIYIAAATQGRVPVRDLSERMTARRPRRYRRRLASALNLLRDGVLSALEHRYTTDVERAHGLPAADRQVPFLVDGRTLWEDATYDRVGVPLTIRLDGRAVHSMPEVAFRDRRRDNAGELSGRNRLSYGWDEVANDPCGVAREVVAVLRRGGWTGAVNTCGRCALVRG